MASVQLTKRDIDNERLPGVCMCCSSAATVSRNHTFFWQPMDANATQIAAVILRLAGIILIRFSDKRSMTVPVPLCDRHKYTFRWHAVLQYGGLLLLLLLSFLFILAVVNGPDSMDEIRGVPPDGRKTVTAIAGSLCFLEPIVWLAALVIYSWLSIRATEITDDSITLTNVSREFADEFDGR